LELKNCKLDDSACKILIDGIMATKSTIVHLDLTQNDLRPKAAIEIAKLIRNYDKQDKLESVILDKNSIGDAGLQEISVGLNDRYTNMGSSNKPPLRYLSIAATKITERGFAWLSQRLDVIFSHMEKYTYKDI